MTREQLTALRDAIDTVLTWPDAVRAEVARWLALEAAKPNGHDLYPPLESSSAPRRAKAARNKFSTRTAELRLLETMRDSPGLSVTALARGAAVNRATTRGRLQQLAAQGEVEKDGAGLWRLTARPTMASPS
jgi:IclR helix-turn-helix domain